MQNQNPNRRFMPMVQFAQHRLNPGAATITKNDTATQPFRGKPPAFMVFNQQRAAAHAAAHRDVTKAARAAEVRKRDMTLTEALAAIDALLHPNAARRGAGSLMSKAGGLGDLLRSRVQPRQPRSNSVRLFGAISKVDDDKRMVYGYASTTSLDSQGEMVTKAALTAALPDYMKFANIREMHQASAVGVATSAEVDEKGLYISARIVDDAAWAKVKAGVYKGFSIGGSSTAKADGVISGMRLSEISLVDRPANPECKVELWKAAK